MKAGRHRESLIAAVVALALALGANLGSALADSSSKVFLGSWKGTATATFPPVLVPPLASLITFSPGGGAVESRRLFVPASPFGDLLETTGHGQWVERSHCAFAVKFVFLLQSLVSGDILGTDTVRLDLRLTRTGGGEPALSGVFESVVEDLDGFELFRASGTYEATPILVDTGHDKGDDDNDNVCKSDR